GPHRKAPTSVTPRSNSPRDLAGHSFPHYFSVWANGDQRQRSLGLHGVRRRLDVHHVVKRSQGGSDFDLDLLVALCRWCHDQTDAPYERGRLVVTALGAGQFTFEVVQRAAGRTSPARVPTFAHVGKTDARDVMRVPPD